jgi:hypothetical protein
VSLHNLGDAKQHHQLSERFSGKLSLAIADHRSQNMSLHSSHYKSIAYFVPIAFENIAFRLRL